MVVFTCEPVIYSYSLDHIARPESTQQNCLLSRVLKVIYSSPDPTPQNGFVFYFAVVNTV